MRCLTIRMWVDPKSHKVQTSSPLRPCANHKFKGADVENSIVEHAQLENNGKV